MNGADFFGPGSNPDQRIIPNYERLDEVISALRVTRPKIKVILTSGTFDLTHVGHCRYLEKARSLGDLLVVGVDSDEKTRKRKGPNRPVVPEDERVEMLAHMRHVDLLIIKESKDNHWQLIKTVKPDVLVITKRNKYTAEEIAELKTICGDVAELEPQATTSTTNRIRFLMINFAQEVRDKLLKASSEINEAMNAVSKVIGG